MHDEPIAAVDAVRRGKLECTIRTSARGTDIEGTLCKVETDTQIILGRVGRIDLSNQMHDDPAFKTLIMANGHLPYFSGNADIEQTEIEIVSCINKKTRQIEPKKANPRSGTAVFRVDAEIISEFIPEKQYFMNIGTLPTDNTVHLSIINRHYGIEIDKGGFAEAKHRGYFGRNGSGKTVAALTHLAGRLVQHTQLGCFIPDTAGDISLSDTHSRGDYAFSFRELLDRGARSPEIIEIGNVRLQSGMTLEYLLIDFFMHILSAKRDNLEMLAHYTRLANFSERIENIDDVSVDELLQSAAEFAPKCWSKTLGQQKAEELLSFVGSPYAHDEYENTVRKFFKGQHNINSLITRFLNDGEIIILQMYSLEDKDKEFVMHEIFNNLTWQTENAFKKKNGQMVNAEIVLDEAPRWVPQSSRERIPSLIRDAAKNTRKYGLSWTFIGQRPANVDNDVISQLHTVWLGRGLGVGADRDHMERDLGRVGLEEYDRLNAQGGFFWMGVGDEINLGVGTSYISTMSYSGDATNKIIAMNPHIWR
jgi:hypothetical protein